MSIVDKLTFNTHIDNFIHHQEDDDRLLSGLFVLAYNLSFLPKYSVFVTSSEIIRLLIKIFSNLNFVTFMNKFYLEIL